MAPAEASPEVAVNAAEPPEAAVLASAPCMVVGSSNTCPVRRVMVEGTVDEQCTRSVSELYLFPEATTVEPPEVAVSAAEPSEVSVVTVCKTLSCPVMATKPVCELLSSPESATEAVYELFSCPDPAEEATNELSVLLITAKDSVSELYDCPVTNELAMCT